METFGHKEDLDCVIVDVGCHNSVLGMFWLNKHDLTISWKDKILTFSSKYCHENCLDHGFGVAFNQQPEIELASTEELPDYLADYEYVFEKEENTLLPLHRPYNISIDLKDRVIPRHGPVYSVGIK